MSVLSKARMKMLDDWYNITQSSFDWWRKISKLPSHELKSSVNGNRLFSTGNSGCSLKEVVLKTGPGVEAEGRFCQTLGTAVAPEVYTVFTDGYVMEKLTPSPKTCILLTQIEHLLSSKVWCRPPIPQKEVWRESLHYFGVDVPSWVTASDTCLTHGDPTVSNAMTRDDSLVMVDPRPPRPYVPQSHHADRGRILQSAFGWETVAYGQPPVSWTMPFFWEDEEDRRQALFWAGAAAARILKKELSENNREHIIDWCKSTIMRCWNE